MQPCYGLAESTLVVATGRPGERPRMVDVDTDALGSNRLDAVEESANGSRKLVGCGPPIPGHEVAILDEDGRFPDEENVIGEICVKGPSVTKGYRSKNAEDSMTFTGRIDDRTGPWLRTGDLGGFIDGDLFVVGRLKDLIIVGGTNHHPQDLEHTAEGAHPAIQTGGCAAFSVEGDDREKVTMVIELDREIRRRVARDGETALETLREEVVKAVVTAISAVHSVRVSSCRVVRSGSIPKTTSGKIRRHATAIACARDELES